jgi:hypothetical protein
MGLSLISIPLLVSLALPAIPPARQLKFVEPSPGRVKTEITD